MNQKSLSLRLDLGLYELLEREARQRGVSVAQVIYERLITSYKDKSDGV